MKKTCKAVVSFLVVLMLLATFSVNVFAAYDPETKADMITYRNFFGTARDVEVNGKTITAEEYPVVTFFNGGARDESYYSEANYNGAVFLFSNATIKEDSNVVSIFYDYDQRHGDVRSTEYYIYAAAPGTAAEEAMTDANQVAVLDYNKDDQIWDEVATDTWTDFYSEVNAGPMTASVDVKAGTYDIYVLVQMIDVDDTFADDNLKDISAKLAEINFMKDSSAPVTTDTPATETPAETETPPATEAPTEEPAATTPPVTETKAPATADATQTPDASGSENGGDSTMIIVIVVIVVVVIIAVVVFIAAKKKKA